MGIAPNMLPHLQPLGSYKKFHDDLVAAEHQTWHIRTTLHTTPRTQSTENRPKTSMTLSKLEQNDAESGIMARKVLKRSLSPQTPLYEYASHAAVLQL